LSISIFFTSLPAGSQTLGPGEDPLYECRPRPTGDTERQATKVKFLEDSARLSDDRIRTKEQELTQTKAELEVAKARVQDTSSGARDSSVMDERQRLIDKVKMIQDELKALRTAQNLNAQNLKMAQDTLHAQKERDKLTNSSIEIFTLTTGELERNSIAGSIADNSLQLMALATSAVNHLVCTPSSDTDSASYAIFKAASAAYLTNNLSNVMDYENLAECVTKKALNPNEKKDVQYALIKRARDLFKEMEKHVTETLTSRTTDFELFNKALEYSMKEWAAKNKRVEVGYAAWQTADQNEQDAYNWWLGVMIAAITMSALVWVPFFGAIAALAAIALWAFWGADLVPKYNAAKLALKDAVLELKISHQHTSLNCNYGDAKRWDLARELSQFDQYLAAKKLAKDAELAEEEARRQQYKEQQYQNEKQEREQSGVKSSYLILKPKFLVSRLSWSDFFINKLFAQDEEVLGGAVTKIQDAYVRSTSTETMKGSIATQGDSRSRIPQFTPGTPQGAAVVENLRRIFETKKQAFDGVKVTVDRMYERLEALMRDYNDYATRMGNVANGDPEIKCSNEWPFPYYRTQNANWDSTPAGRNWANTWRTRGCTRDNKNTLEAKQTAMSDYYTTITPFETMMNILELAMDQAELDYLTALQINEGADPSDPLNPNLTPQSREAAAYADFLGKIKAEWKTSSINTEKNNFILVDRTTNWTLEKLLNEHAGARALPPNKKAGFSDAYTRYIYMEYAVDLIIKNMEMLGRAKALALGQALSYQELLNQADNKLGLDAVALPDASLRVVKGKACMKSGGQVDPACSCKARGTCSKFSFPTAVLHGSSKDQSTGIIEGYANDTFSGSEGARVSGEAVRRNAAATKASINEVKSTIINQRKTMGFQNTEIENTSNLLGASIQADARRSAAAAVSPKTSTGRGARILALETKITPEKVSAALAATTAPKKFRKAPLTKKEKIEMGILSIDEEVTGTEGEMEIEGLDLDLSGPGKVETKEKAAEVSAEKPAGVEYDPSKTIWKNITKRYQKSAFPRLLKKKKEE